MASKSEITRAAIVQAGLDIWRKNRAAPSMRAISAVLGMTHGAMYYHFADVETMQNEIASAAIKASDAEIVPLLIVTDHPAAAALSDRERRRILGAR